MLSRILGLDIGINSIGFALLALDDNAQEGEILCHGVHLFDKAEGTDGESLAEPYRNFRGARRVIRRRVGRLKALRKLFTDHGIPFFPAELTDVDKEGMNRLSATINPWQLRAEALERLLTPYELAQALYHIAKHRGFQSNKKGEVLTGEEKEKDLDDTGKMLIHANSLRSRLNEAKAPSVGSYFYGSRLRLGQKVRNTDGDYSNTILRQLHREEVALIFERQRALGSTIATPELENAYAVHAFEQRPLQSVADMIGFCSLEKEERRAVKHSRSAERFVLWTKINHCRIINSHGVSRPLTQDERQILYRLAHLHKTTTYSQVRKALNLPIEEYFNGVRYQTGGKAKRSKKKAEASQSAQDQEGMERWEDIVKTVEDKTTWISLPGYYRLKGILGENIEALKQDTWDAIATILSVEQALDVIEQKLIEGNTTWGLTQEQIDSLKVISDFKGTVGHSAKAIQNLLPYLEAGDRYDEAVLKAYGKAVMQRFDKLPPFPETTNPIVNRALAQTRKVINAIIRRYGMPDRIHVELAREIAKNKKERDKLEEENKKNAERNQAIRNDIAREGLAVDPLVYRLWVEQGNCCAYSGEHIPLRSLQDGTLVQVDHILPRSRSFDNSYMNKVLVFSGENQDKGDRTPWEYFQADKPDHAWDELMARIAHWPKPKRDRLTNQHFNEREAEWKERHLNDTRWITRQVLNHIQATLALPGEPNQTNVMALNGKITADLRHAWGFARKSRTTPKHHAIDAMVIAACTQTMVQRVTAFNKYRARARALGEQVYAPNPWPTFRQDVMARIDDPNWIISRLANRKVTGEINGPNPARTRKNAQGEEREVIRLTLAGLKKEQVKKLDAMIDKETRNKWLYDALLQAIADAGGDPQKAFKPPFTLNTPSGPKVIKKVSLWGDKIMSGRRLRGGVVSNGSQVRVDVFEKDGKFYLVPVFAWHFRVGHLPMGYCKQKVAQENWPEIDDSYTFKFSLYSNDYVRCVKPNGEVVAGYYKTTHIAMGQICIQPHDAPDTTNLPHPGVLTLKTFEKFHVDYFGKLTLVTETVRPPVKWRKKSRVAHHYGSKARQTVPTP